MRAGLLELSVVAEFLGQRPAEMKERIELDRLPTIAVPCGKRVKHKVALSALHRWLAQRSTGEPLTVAELEVELERAQGGAGDTAAAQGAGDGEAGGKERGMSIQAGDLVTVRVPVRAAKVEKQVFRNMGHLWKRVEMPLADGGEDVTLEEILPGERLEVVEHLMLTGEVIVRPLLNGWHCLELLEGVVAKLEGGAA